MLTLTVQNSNYAAIIQAIAQIAQTGQNTIQFSSGSVKIGEVPTPDDLQKQDNQGNFISGYPFFAVRKGRLAGFATGAELRGEDDTGERGIMQVEPVWDFDCYVFYEYSVDVPNDDKVTIALVTMYKTFFENYTLNNTCALSNPMKLTMPYAQIGNKELVAAKWTLRCYEILESTYQ